MASPNRANALENAFAYVRRTIYDLRFTIYDLRFTIWEIWRAKLAKLRSFSQGGEGNHVEMLVRKVCELCEAGAVAPIYDLRFGE